MPDLTYSLKRHREESSEVALLTLWGYIDPSTVKDFEAALEEVLQKNSSRVILDFAGIQYINSSGIFALLNLHNELIARGGESVIVNVSYPVGTTMHLLGLTKVVPILNNPTSAVAYLKEDRRKKGVAGLGEFLRKKKDIALTSPLRFVLPLRKLAPAPQPKGSTILLVVNREDEFTKILGLRFAQQKAKARIVHSCVDALRLLEHVPLDAIILEDRVRYSEEFLAKVKIEKNRIDAPILKLYTRGVDLDKMKQFKVLEDDYLVEPFELMELFTLVEAEIRRMPERRKEGIRHVHFQFKSTEPNFKRANELFRNLLNDSGLDKEGSNALAAAFREGLDNGVRHGNRSDPDRGMDLVASLGPEKVSVAIRDEGDGFPFRELVSRVSRQDLGTLHHQVKSAGKRGGLGLLVMLRCADRVLYTGKGNRLVLEKFVRPPPAAPSAKSAR